MELHDNYKKKIFISAAETSSDIHGAHLLKSLKSLIKEQKPSYDVSFFGVGGVHLKNNGLRAVFDSSSFLSMGIGEILTRIPFFFHAYYSLVKEIKTQKPDLAVLMDYPGFHFLLARKLKKLNIPMVYYIPPKVWVWRKYRVHFLRKVFKKVLCVFPFEEEFFHNYGVNCKYVGNPLLDELKVKRSKDEIKNKYSIREKDKALLLMPGSRPAEINSHLLIMLFGTLTLKIMLML